MSPLPFLLLSFGMAAAAFVVLVTRLLHPYHRRLALILYGGGWVPFLGAVWLRWDEVSDQAAVVEGALLGHGPLVGLGALLLGLGYAARVLFPLERSPLVAMSDADLDAQLLRDEALLLHMQRLSQENLDDIRDSRLLTGSARALEEDEEATVRTLWARFVELQFELNVLQARYQHFAQIHPVRRAALHRRAFLVAYGAYVEEYRAGLELAMQVGRNTAIKAILNEESAQIPAGAYAALRKETAHPDTVLRLNAGRAYRKLLPEPPSPGAAEAGLAQRLRDNLDKIDTIVTDRTEVVLRSPLDYLERRAFHFWFPLQKGIAQQMGHIRMSSTPFAIQPAHVQAHRAALTPGDILLERREWCLSNLGIPGYWTHAALYLGTLPELEAYFADLPELEGRTVAEALRELRPAALAVLRQPDPTDGFPRAVIEAVGEGVILTSLEHSCRADAVAALQPIRADRARRWQAIVEALAHHGKPYDYDFDFSTDSALVCSELIFKAWREGGQLTLTPVRSKGRILLSPNEIAIKFDAEYDDPARRELELALFLDSTSQGEVLARPLADFRPAWRRPKWHILFAS